MAYSPQDERPGAGLAVLTFVGFFALVIAAAATGRWIVNLRPPAPIVKAIPAPAAKAAPPAALPAAPATPPAATQTQPTAKQVPASPPAPPAAK